MNIKKCATKEKIIQAAWELFLENGYGQTTLQDIIKKSQTSRGAFYHHFCGKEDLLFSLAYYFDNDYTNWLSELNPEANTLDKLYEFDDYVLRNLENSPYRQFLPELYGYQVMTSGTRYILNPDRTYYKLITQLMKEGLDRGQICSGKSCHDLAHDYATLQRSYTYNWCLENFRYSLVESAHPIMKLYLDSLRT